MEESGHVYHVEPAIERSQARRIENVPRHELRVELLPVAEELVPQLDELRAEIRACQALRRGAVRDELAEDLAEAARHFEQRAAGFEPLDDGLVFRRGSDVDVQEPPAADAGVVEDAEGLLTLPSHQSMQQ